MTPHWHCGGSGFERFKTRVPASPLFTMVYINRLETTGADGPKDRPEFQLGLDNVIGQILQVGTIANAQNVLEGPPYTDFKRYLVEEAWRNAKKAKVDPLAIPDWMKEAIYRKLIFMRDEARSRWMASEGREPAEYEYDFAQLPSLESLTQPSP